MDTHTSSMSSTSSALIEPRKPTAEPLVEIRVNADGTDGAYAPTGRRFAAVEGQNSYGLTDPEDVAYLLATERLSGKPFDANQITTHEEHLAVEAAKAADPNADAGKVIAEYRAAHPLPTSFAALSDGDIHSNDAPTAPAAPVAQLELVPSAPNSASPTPAPLAPITIDVATGNPAENVSGELIPGVLHVSVPAATVQAHASKLREFVSLVKRDFTIGGHHALDGIERIAHELASLV